jgi:Fe-S-cluster containining protein
VTSIQELLRELAADNGYNTGAKQFPRRVGDDEAVELARHLQSQVDRGVESRAEYAARRNDVIACARGCNACCDFLVMIYLPEAKSVARWLEQPENAATKAQFLAAYPRWRERIGEGPELLGDLAVAGKTEEHTAAHVAQFKKRAQCAFNHEGDCTIYAVRPVLCRAHHAVETAEHCRADDSSGIPARRLIYKPLDQFVEKSTAFLRVAQHAMGGPVNRPLALCQAVYELLTVT